MSLHDGPCSLGWQLTVLVEQDQNELDWLIIILGNNKSWRCRKRWKTLENHQDNRTFPRQRWQHSCKVEIFSCSTLIRPTQLQQFTGKAPSARTSTSNKYSTFFWSARRMLKSAIFQWLKDMSRCTSHYYILYVFFFLCDNALDCAIKCGFPISL